MEVRRDATWTPSRDELAQYLGTFSNTEVETTLAIDLINDALVVRRRPDVTIPLRPHSTDRFEAGLGLGLVTFRRTSGKVDALSITQDRVWDLRFTRGAGGVIGDAGVLK